MLRFVSRIPRRLFIPRLYQSSCSFDRSFGSEAKSADSPTPPTSTQPSKPTPTPLEANPETPQPASTTQTRSSRKVSLNHIHGEIGSRSWGQGAGNDLSVRGFLPFFVFICVGSLLIYQIQKFKFADTTRRVRRVDDKEVKAKSADFDMEDEFRRLEENGTWGEWENKRIPRPEGENPYGTRTARLQQMKAEGRTPIQI